MEALLSFGATSCSVEDANLGTEEEEEVRSHSHSGTLETGSEADQSCLFLATSCAVTLCGQSP